MINIALIVLPLGFGCIVLIAHFTFPNAEPTFEPLPFPISPNNTVILFDIHGVLFTTDYAKLAHILLTTGKTWTLIAHSINPFLWYDLGKLARRNVVAQEYFNYLTSNYPKLANLMPLFIALANAQKPIPSTVSLVKNLKHRGYSLHVLSNIGDEVFEQLKKEFNDIFDHFEAIKVASSQEGYQGKPHAPLFQNYLEQFNSDDKQVIFIDNKHTNVQAARSLGMIAIHYKNSSLLSAHLQQLTVL